MKKFIPYFLLCSLFVSAFLFRNTPATTPHVYRGVIAQEAESDPYEAYVYQNDLGVTFTGERVDVGQINLNASAGIFASNAKVFMQTSLYNEGADATNLCLMKTRRWDSDTIRVSTFQQDPETGMYIAGDDCSFYLEIIVYP